MNPAADRASHRKHLLARAKLYVLLTPELLPPAAWRQAAADLIRGGADLLQLRLKNANTAERAALGRSLMEIVAPSQALLIVNDDPEAAVLAGSDGVHVGDDDATPHAARAIVGDDLIVGRSTHDLEDILQAVQTPIDYFAIGSIYPSTTKQARAIVGPYVLHRIQREIPLKCFAIGGITRTNVHEVLACGGDGIAVSSAILSAPDIAAETAWFRQVLDAPRTVV
jgi:thiamine-phosphate pyrophosphorylase